MSAASGKTTGVRVGSSAPSRGLVARSKVNSVSGRPSTSSSTASSVGRKTGKTTMSELLRKSKFSAEELDKLLILYRNYAGTRGSSVSPSSAPLGGDMNKQQWSQFLSAIGLHSPLTERIFDLINASGSGLLDFRECAMGLSTMMRGSFDQKVRFCFRVYDRHETGYLSRQDMYQLFDLTLDLTGGAGNSADATAMFMSGFHNKEERERDLWDLVHLMINKMDADKDSRVDFGEYKAYVKKDGLLMEAFGPVLPPLPRKNENLFDMPQ